MIGKFEGGLTIPLIPAGHMVGEYHGREGSAAEGARHKGIDHITVRASTRPGDGGTLLVLEVSVTGAGLPATLPTPGPGQSFGLAQARERLATLHGAAGTLDLIAIDQGGTSAKVTFPLKSSPSA